MEIVIEDNPIDIDSSMEGLTIFKELGRAILEEIYCQAMDYQALIDSNSVIYIILKHSGQNLVVFQFFFALYKGILQTMYT